MNKIERIIESYNLESAFSAAPHIIRHAISKKRFGDSVTRMEGLRYSVTEDNYSLQGFDKLNCIFIHIPKCAGVSITNALFGNLAGGHIPLYLYLALYGSQKFDSMYKFTFVRNPWDRVASAFYFLKKGGANEQDRLWAKEWLTDCDNLDKFVIEYLPNPVVRKMAHFCTQSELLIDPRTKKVGVDYIGRYENIENDFTKVSLSLGLDVSLPKLNKSSNKKSWKNEMSVESISVIGNLYAEDVSNFGYIE